MRGRQQLLPEDPRLLRRLDRDVSQWIKTYTPGALNRMKWLWQITATRRTQLIRRDKQAAWTTIALYQSVLSKSPIMRLKTTEVASWLLHLSKTLCQAIIVTSPSSFTRQLLNQHTSCNPNSLKRMRNGKRCKRVSNRKSRRNGRHKCNKRRRRERPLSKALRSNRLQLCHSPLNKATNMSFRFHH